MGGATEYESWPSSSDITKIPGTEPRLKEETKRKQNDKRQVREITEISLDSVPPHYHHYSLLGPFNYRLGGGVSFFRPSIMASELHVLRASTFPTPGCPDNLLVVVVVCPSSTRRRHSPRHSITPGNSIPTLGSRERENMSSCFMSQH